MGYRASFGLRILAVAAVLGLMAWGTSAVEVAAPNGLKSAFSALLGTGSATAKAATPTASPGASVTAAPTASTSTATTSAATASATARPFMATLTNTCVPDPSLPQTYYAGTHCSDPDLRYNKYLLTLASEVYHVVGYQPKLIQLGQETCDELALYDQSRVVMDVTQWLVAEQNPAKPRAAALSVLNAATKNLCPALRGKVTLR